MNNDIVREREFNPLYNFYFKKRNGRNLFVKVEGINEDLLTYGKSKTKKVEV